MASPLASTKTTLGETSASAAAASKARRVFDPISRSTISLPFKSPIRKPMRSAHG